MWVERWSLATQNYGSSVRLEFVLGVSETLL